MKGFRQLDDSTIWENGSRTYPPGMGKAADPPKTWTYPPPNGTPVEVADETPAQGQGGTPIVLTPTAPVVNKVRVIQGSIRDDGSTIWDDGSRTYVPHKGQATHAPDPPGTWQWPQPGGTPTTKLEPVQGPVILTLPSPQTPPEVQPMIYEIWMGPVSAQQVKGAQVPGAQLSYLGCLGDGKPTCAEIAEGFKDAEGRILPGLLKNQKIQLNAGDQLWLGAFSAGGQIVKRAMLDARDRAQITGALLADAGYEAAWIDQKAGIAPFIEGYVLFALDALQNNKVFVWTASANPNVSTQNAGVVYPAGDQVLDATRQEIERRAGVKFVDVTQEPAAWPWGAGGRAPTRIWRLQNVILCDYGSSYQHPEHATVLAPMIWASIPQIIAGAPGQPAPEPAIASSGGIDAALEKGRTWWRGLSRTGKGAVVAVAALGGIAAVRRI